MHSYQLKSDKAFIVYFQELPSTMETTEIKEALEDLGYTPHQVANVQWCKDGVVHLRPLFCVELELSSMNPEVYCITSLLQVRIKVESFKLQTDPPQCHNCQQLGHTRHYYL